MNSFLKPRVPKNLSERHSGPGTDDSWLLKKKYSKKQMAEDQGNTFILMLQNSVALIQLLSISAKLDSIRRLLEVKIRLY